MQTDMQRTLQPRYLFFVLALVALLIAACGAESSPTVAEPEAPAAAEAEEAAAPAEDEASEPAEEPAAEEATEGAAEEGTAEETSTDETSADESGLPSGQVSYMIVPEETTASYIADEEFFQDALPKYGIPVGTQGTVGSTSAIEGSFTLNWSDLSQQPLGENTFTVDLSTLESDQGLRDRWLRNNGPEFNTYPTATFAASELQGAPESYTMGETVEFDLVGELTIRETTQPATFTVSAALNDGTVTGTATTTALMSDFGIEPPNFANTLTVADEFQIEIDFTAQAQ